MRFLFANQILLGVAVTVMGLSFLWHVVQSH